MMPWPPDSVTRARSPMRPAHGVLEQARVLEGLVPREAAVEVGDEPDQLAARRRGSRDDRRQVGVGLPHPRGLRRIDRKVRDVGRQHLGVPVDGHHRQVAAEGQGVGLLQPSEDRMPHCAGAPARWRRASRRRRRGSPGRGADSCAARASRCSGPARPRRRARPPSRWTPNSAPSAKSPRASPYSVAIEVSPVAITEPPPATKASIPRPARR